MVTAEYESWDIITEVDVEISDGVPVPLGDGSSRPPARLGEAWWNDHMRDQTLPAEITKPCRRVK